MESLLSNFSHTGLAPTSDEIQTAYDQAFEQHLSHGTLMPFVFPYHLFGYILLTVYLCIPHKESPKVYTMRWPLLVFINWFEYRLIRKTSGVGPGMGSFAGSFSAYTIMASWTWLVFKRPQWDAKRVQRTMVKTRHIKNGVTKLKEGQSQNGDLRQRRPAANQSLKVSDVGFSGDTHKEDNIETYQYFWQSYPDNLRERIFWVLDLLYNARGPGWNWAISSIPSLPPEILIKLRGPVSDHSYSNFSSAGCRRFNTRYEHLIYRVSCLLTCYITLDVLSTVMMKDPYFKFGPITTYALPSYLESLPPPILQFYRTVLTAIGIIAYMTIALNVLPIFLSGILGPRILGLRAEPWYYPSEWGYFSNIYKKGLSGLWGDYWHQTFRLHFTSPMNFLIRGGYIKPGTFIAKTVLLLCAFGLSGFLHWASSTTTLPRTNPSHAMMFFVLQGLGIILQRAASQIFSSHITKLPKFIRYYGNFTFILIWIYFIGWLLADDFARSGIWIMDPVPVSFSRLLGFGEPNVSWLSKRPWFRRYKGKNWWECGIALA